MEFKLINMKNSAFVMKQHTNELVTIKWKNVVIENLINLEDYTN